MLALSLSFFFYNALRVRDYRLWKSWEFLFQFQERVKELLVKLYDSFAFHMIITFQKSITTLTVDLYIISIYLVWIPILRWDKWYQTCIMYAGKYYNPISILPLNFYFRLKKMDYYFSGNNYPHNDFSIHSKPALHHMRRKMNILITWTSKIYLQISHLLMIKLWFWSHCFFTCPIR